MAEDLNLIAKIAVDVNKAIDDLARLRQAVDAAGGGFKGLDPAIDKVEKRLVGVTQKINGVTTATKAETTATQQATKAKLSEEQSRRAHESALIRERYALYDVASTYGIVSAALLAASGYAVKTAADFESAFTAVERTLEDGTSVQAIADIRSELVDLSTTIPKTFADVSQIATLGNQLGVASDDLITFTDLVAKFSTVTGITAEASAQAFGRIGNILGLTADDYDNLASAIVYVGRTSAATEAQIISLTERLGATASRAGFTADQVVGLAGALASVGVAPERAQGVLETYFNTLNEAVVSGGDALKNFSVLTGLTTDEITRLVDSGGGLQVFEKVLQSLGDTTNSQTTKALQELGLTGLRVNEVIPRLANNFDLFERSLSNSSKAYSDATEIGDQYSKVADDLNTQFQLLVNSVNALIEELSGGLVPGLAGAVGGLADFVNGLREIADNKGVQTVAGLVLAINTFIGVLFAYRAAVALSIASSYALSTAFGTMGASASLSGAGAIRGLIAALLGLNAANAGAVSSTTALTTATVASNATLGLSAANMTRAAAAGTALKGALLGAGPVGVALGAALIAIPLAQFASDSASAAKGLQDIKTASDALAASGSELKDALGASFDEITKYEEDLAGLNGGVAELDAGVNKFFSQFFDATPALTDAREQLALIDGQLASMVQSGNAAQAAAIIEQTGVSAYRAARLLPAYGAALRAVGASAGAINSGPIAAFTRGVDSASAATTGLGKSAGGAAPKVRTLVDYANDLGTVFGRAFDIRFGSQSAIDDVTASFQDLADRIRDAQTELLKLTADKNVKEYFLSVANAYGDTLRAGILTGEIADINGKIAETQADASTELTGNSKAAIKNRKTITGLVSEYQDYIQALAASGADQGTLNAAVAQSKNDFMAQATALGYSNAQLQPYIASFGDMAIAISKVPRNITVTASTSPALQAINEFMAQARAATAGGINLAVNGVVTGAARDAAFLEWVTLMQRTYGRALAQSPAGWTVLRRNWESGMFGQFYTGGYTGAGGKYEPAGVVHKGEYVIPKSQVNQRTGLPYADALGGVQRGSRGGSSSGYAGGGYVNPGSMVMQLSPRDRAIMGAKGDIVIQIDGREVARAVNSANKQQNFAGAY